MIRVEINSLGKTDHLLWPEGCPVPGVGDTLHLEGASGFTPDWEWYMGVVTARVFFCPTFIRLVVSRRRP